MIEEIEIKEGSFRIKPNKPETFDGRRGYLTVTK